jgi:phosphoribosylanthranilate isomerase
MTATRVKLCGLTNPEDRDVAIRAGADAVGFISQVSVDTEREISPARASDLVSGMPPFVTSVLVTMPASVEEAVDLQAQVNANALQIHETLSPQQLNTLSERIDAQVIAVVDVAEPEIPAYADVTDVLLVDSTREDGGGGTGETHDWERTRDIAAKIDVPLVLAGGLHPNNVRSAIETVNPFGVDTASGVERVEGQKDHSAVELFVNTIRQTETTNPPGRTA